jgi:hypothetical protein
MRLVWGWMMNSDQIRADLEPVLRPYAGFYDFGVAGQSGSKTIALITAYDSKSHTDRQVSGLEIIIIKTPQITIRSHLYQVYLKQYAEGHNGLEGAIGAIQKLYALATFIPLPQPENQQLLAIVSCKIPIIPLMG